jgi:hypothetical protein
MLPYLRRYYDLAIAAVGASDAEKVASLILASRDQSAGPTQTAVLFHFRRHDGCVVLRAPQGSAEYHALTFGRAELRSPQSQTAGKLRLPDALVARIQAERSQGHTVAMFWSDEPCWAQTEDALTDKDWPFAAQLDLKATAGTVTASR